MLKRVIVNNFVKFKDTQTISFGGKKKAGLFIFVGANETGKSSIFEAVRRCSELRKNLKISKRLDDSKESLVICVFEGKNHNGKTKCLLSYYLLWEEVVAKAQVVCYPDSTEPEKVAFAWSNLPRNIPERWHEASNCQELASGMTVLTKCASTDDDGNYIYRDDMIGEIISTLKNTYESNIGREASEQHFDKMFTDFTKMEFLFAHRGISMIESSEQIEGRDLTIYQKASENAYVIKRFLQSVTTDEHQQVYDVEKEREMFDLITSSTKREFILVEGSDVIRLKSEKGYADLLKVSEGIVEAKNLSILLSKRGINTLFLEEPGRGMHRDCTDILLNKILLRERFTGEKIIAMTTHNRDFVSPSTISKTIFFSKNDDGSCRINRLTSTDGKVIRFVADDTVSSIFFSRHCIFVEGLTDAILVNAIKDSFLNSDSLMHIISTNEDEQNGFRDFLATLRVIRLEGEGAKGKAETVCKGLGLERKRIFLFDRDVLSGERNQKKFKDQLMLDESIDLKNFTALEKEGIFLWDPEEYTFQENIKEGTLEDAMFETIRLHIERHHHDGVTCMIENCKASEYEEELLKWGKQMLKTATDEFVEEFVQELILYQTGQIQRFVKFLTKRSGLNHRQ